MRTLSHKLLAKLELCDEELQRLKKALPQESFSAREGFKAYTAAGGIEGAP